MVENAESDEVPTIKGKHREKLEFSDAVVNNYHRKELYVERGGANLRQKIIPLENLLNMLHHN